MKTPTHDERDDKQTREHEKEDREHERDRQHEKSQQKGYGAGTQAAPPDPYKTYTLADFAVDFLANLPAGAASGKYTAEDGDRWSTKTADGQPVDPPPRQWAIDSGTHDSHGWHFTFRDGRFVSAERFVDGDIGLTPTPQAATQPAPGHHDAGSPSHPQRPR